MYKSLILYIFPLSIFVLLFPNISQAGILDVLPCLECGNCNFVDVTKFFYDLMVWLFGIVGAVALLFFIWGGVQWLISGGNSERINRGKQIMINTSMAIVVVLGSNLLLKFILTDVMNINLSDSGESTLSVCEKPADKPVGGNGACTSPWEGGLSCGGSCVGITTSGINSQQCSDASPSLEALLTCLKAGVNNNAALDSNDIIITSVSQDVGLATCRDNWNSTSCVHTNHSCHYGGPAQNINGSYAADLRSSNLSSGERDIIRNIVQSCGGTYLLESDHLHISAGGCGGT
jgi:hypothetical protein